MGMIFKTIVAFCLGIGALTAAQSVWMSAITAQLRSEMAHPSALLPQGQITPTVSVDGDKLRQALRSTMGPIDTSAYERLGVESAARRVDMQIRGAQSAVPVQRSYPGVPRF